MKYTTAFSKRITEDLLERDRKILFSSNIKDYPEYKYTEGRIHCLLDLLAVIKSKKERKIPLDINLLLERQTGLYEDYLLYEGLVTNYLNTDVVEMPEGYTGMDALYDGYDDYLSKVNDENKHCLITDFASYRYYLGKLHIIQQCKRIVEELKKKL